MVGRASELSEIIEKCEYLLGASHQIEELKNANRWDDAAIIPSTSGKRKINNRNQVQNLASAFVPIAGVLLFIVIVIMAVSALGLV